MLVRGELALGGHRMVVFDVNVVDVAWHGGSACAFGVIWAVVPVDSHEYLTGEYRL